MTLAVAHARLLLLETVRVPVAVLFTLVFPALLFLVFVVPLRSVAQEPFAATIATAQLAVFAVMNAYLLNFGVGVAEERSRPWDPFLRTLPAGPVPRVAGRLLHGVALATLSLLPVLVVAVLLTQATASPTQLVLGGLAVVGGTLPFLFGGLAIGYTFPAKAALPVAQFVLLPFALLGGLLLPLALFPSWLEPISRLVPTRGARDLVTWAVTGTPPATSTSIAWVGWLSVTAVAAVVAYRRDEGRRFS